MHTYMHTYMHTVHTMHTTHTTHHAHHAHGTCPTAQPLHHTPEELSAILEALCEDGYLVAPSPPPLPQTVRCLCVGVAHCFVFVLCCFVFVLVSCYVSVVSCCFSVVFVLSLCATLPCTLTLAPPSHHAALLSPRMYNPRNQRRTVISRRPAVPSPRPTPHVLRERSHGQSHATTCGCWWCTPSPARFPVCHTSRRSPCGTGCTRRWCPCCSKGPRTRWGRICGWEKKGE